MSTLRCPECNSSKVALTSEQMFMANTGEMWCESVKIYDSAAKVTCLDCRWEGTRFQLTGHEDRYE